MTDGLRWQEVFQGADATLMNKENGSVSDAAALLSKYPKANRQALMPFLWDTVAQKGQIFGNRKIGSAAHVTNGRNFSYPGYNETLTGFADDLIDSNDKKLNANVTVLEWLHKKPAFQNKVAAFAAWDVMSYIINAGRAGFPFNDGWAPFQMSPMTAALATVNTIKAQTPRLWPDEPFDALPFQTALEFLKTRKPRVLYLSLGETDEWAHAHDYRLYLDSAHQFDSYLKTLWDTLQAIPQYRDTTTLIISTDHGRGQTAANWKSHGKEVAESKEIWMAFLGPDTKALGERKNIAAVTQNQIAATLAALLGEEYAAAQPKAGKPIRDVLP